MNNSIDFNTNSFLNIISNKHLFVKDGIYNIVYKPKMFESYVEINIIFKFIEFSGDDDYENLLKIMIISCAMYTDDTDLKNEFYSKFKFVKPGEITFWEIPNDDGDSIETVTRLS